MKNCCFDCCYYLRMNYCLTKMNYSMTKNYCYLMMNCCFENSMMNCWMIVIPNY